MTNVAQQEFDETYITSTEICETLKINRATVLHARKRGLLPEPISLNNSRLFIWKRSAIQKSLDAWKIMLDARRGLSA